MQFIKNCSDLDSSYELIIRQFFFFMNLKFDETYEFIRQSAMKKCKTIIFQRKIPKL